MIGGGSCHWPGIYLRDPWISRHASYHLSLEEADAHLLGRLHQTKFRSMVLTASCSKKSSSPLMSLTDSLMVKVFGVDVSS